MTNLVLIAMTRSGHNFVQNNLRSWKEYTRYVNAETVRPVNYDSFMKKHKVTGKKDNVILVRDLLNWLASYLKVQLNTKNDIQQVHDYIEVWVDITKEAFDETSLIKNKMVINYDDFKDSIEYRKLICNKIAGVYNERNLNIVPPSGKYSSFDGSKFQNKGSQMKTGDRYMFFKDHPKEEIYKDVLIKHPEAIRLYKKYFNMKQEQKRTLESYGL